MCASACTRRPRCPTRSGLSRAATCDPAGSGAGQRVSVPLGVIAIIYESRPNVTCDAAAACVKSGNAVILRGGSEALRTNVLLADTMARAAEATGVPTGAIQIVRTPDRAAVGELLRQERYIDVIIPRGGKWLIERIAEESRIPVISSVMTASATNTSPPMPTSRWPSRWW